MRIFVLTFSLFFGFQLAAQENIDALKVVQMQLDAYNQRDLKTFASLFSEDITFVEHSNGKPSISGKAQLLERFGSFFQASPELRSNLAGRLVMGNKVIDHEKITGARGSDDIYELMVVYEIHEGLISKVTTIRKEQAK